MATDLRVGHYKLAAVAIPQLSAESYAPILAAPFFPALTIWREAIDATFFERLTELAL